MFKVSNLIQLFRVMVALSLVAKPISLSTGRSRNADDVNMSAASLAYIDQTLR